MDSMPNETVIALPESKLSDSADLLSRAFYDDPLLLYLFPEDKERLQSATRFFLPNLRHACREGAMFTTSSFSGVAIWRFLGFETSDKADANNDPRVQLPELMGIGPFERLMNVVRYTNELHKKLVQGRHFYLLFLGVDPVRQGKGVGGILINPMLQRADVEGITCYLETNKEKNLAFYAKHGFKVGEHRQLPDGGPYLWGLARPPTEKVK